MSTTRTFRILLSCMLMACSGRVVSDDGGADASMPLDSGNPDSGTEDASVPDAGSQGGAGVLSLMQFRTAVTPNHVVGGGFFRGLGVEQLAERAFSPTCQIVASAGPCRFVECTSTPTYEDAGTVTVTVEGTPIASLPQRTNGAYGGGSDTIVAEPGESVAFSATGAVVPAFSGTVLAPGLLTSTFPTTAAQSDPLTITWTTSAPTDRVQLTLAASTGLIACVVEAAAETVTAPPELLAMLPLGDTSVGLSALNTQTVAAGDYGVLVMAGETMSGTLRLE